MAGLKVGYYDLNAHQGLSVQREVITADGYSPVNLSGFSDLAGLSALFIDNTKFTGYATGFAANLPAIQAYVAGGGSLVFHDAAALAGLLPGVAVSDATSGFAFQLDFVDDTGRVADGAGGSLDDTSLDGGAAFGNNTGYIDIEGVADQEFAFLMTRPLPGQGATVMAASGSGYAIYSTIPLGNYLAGSGSGLDGVMATYAQNVLDYAVQLQQTAETQLGAFQDNFTGDGAANDIFGNDGADTLHGGAGSDLLHGGEKNDKLFGGDDADIAWGGAGNDALNGDAGADQLWGGEGKDKLNGGDGDDFMVGGSGDDKLNGGLGVDTIFGNAGADKIAAGGDGGFISGGAGKDQMTAGIGVDVFAFSTGDTGLGGQRDIVNDFAVGQDQIDLRGCGDLSFAGSAFTHHAGEVIITNYAGGNVVQIDLDGDGVADEAITVLTSDHSHGLNGGNLIIV
jgi:Ca2+-binding RTX toxin-like protein